MIDVQEIKEARINAKDRRVKFRYITEITKENISYCKQIIKEFNAELRHLHGVKGNFEINDGGKEYIGAANLQKAKPLKQIIYSNVKEIGEQQQYVFNTLWNKAIPSEEKIKEIEDGIIPEFIEIIQTPEEIQSLEWHLLEATKEEVQIIYSTVKAYKLQEGLGVMDYLAKLSNSGIKVRLLTPKNSSIEKSLQNLKATSNIDINYLETETEIKNKYLITDRKNSLVIELKDKDDDIDKYYHFLRQNEKNQNYIPITSPQSALTILGTSISSNSKSTVSSYISIFETLWKQTELFQKLKQTDSLKTEFINVAAHELRTPVQSIIGYVEMIKAFPERTSSYLQPIERNTQRLYRLLEDILDITKIESGSLKLKKTTFDMNEKIHNVIRDLTPKKNVNDNNNNNTNQNIKFIFQPTKESIIVFADKERIYQVFSNLIKNALKFIPSIDGKIEISLEKVKDENNEKEFVSVKINDNGKGIDKEVLPRLFEKFTTKSETGTGLGLYIAKSIVEAHGGKIWTENNSDGKGATFLFKLPLSNHHQK